MSASSRHCTAPVPDVARAQDSPLPPRLRRHLAASGLVRPGDAVAVALSGGLDSVALLHLLRFPLADLALDLSAAHLDHAMRPRSAHDALWVRGLCIAWGIPLVCQRADPPPASEADARSVRYAFLDRAAPPGARIATAHHLDDQAETVLFRITRGTGTPGLRGIAPRRGRLVRPLLPFTRAELTRYARDAGLRWRDDPTNFDLSFARNRIRHSVLPALERARPDAARALAALAASARRDEAAWEHALGRLERDVVLARDDEALVLARDVLRAYHPHLRARMLRDLLRRFGTTPGRAGTQAALEFIMTGRSGHGVDLSADARLERAFDRIVVRRVSRGAVEDRPLEIADRGPGEGRAVVGGRTLAVRWSPAAAMPDRPPAGDDRQATITASRFPLSLRGWRTGDRIRLQYGSKKLKKLFGEHRLDCRERQRAPVLVDASGTVLWVVGVARASDVAGGEGGLEIVVEDAGQH